MPSGEAEAEASLRGERACPGVEHETHFATPLGHSGRSELAASHAPAVLDGGDVLDGKAGVRAKGSGHVQLQGGKRGQVLLPHVVVSGRLLRVDPLRVVPESEEVQDLDARVPERNQDTQRRTRAELGGVLKPWAAHGRRPGGGKVHPRRVRMKLEAVARQLGAYAGEQASRRVVREEG